MITAIDTQTISKAVNKQLTIEEATHLLDQAGVLHQIDLGKYDAERQGGPFLAQDAHGYIAAEIALTYQLHKLYRDEVFRLMKSRSKKDKIRGMKLVRQIVENECELAEQMAKMCEIVSARSTLITEGQRAPRLTSARPDISIEGSQVVLRIEQTPNAVEPKQG